MNDQSNSSTPFFSIVIPVYNRAHLIEPTIQSCLEQTFEDFELIIVDDGSKDDLKSVIEKINDPRIRYIWRENGGGSAARNTGIDAARGEYISFLDSDDLFLKDKLEKNHAYLSQNDCDCLYGQILVDRGVGKYWTKPPRGPKEGEHLATYLMCDKGWVQTSTLCVKTPLAQKIKYLETLSCGDDMDFAIRLYNDGAKFKMIEEPRAIYMDLPDPDRLSFVRDYDEIMEWTKDLKNSIPKKAYHGHMGWRVAKTIVGKSYFKALGLYLNAVLHGAYKPKMAAIIFLQIFLPKSLYRKVTDAVASLFSRKKIEQK